MTDERREGPDRRRQPRGGRRSSDHAGYAPLVLVVDHDASGRTACETILAKLRFAVAPVDTPERAASIVRALRPEVIVAANGAADDIRKRLSTLERGDGSIPVVAITSQTTPDEIVERIRTALRSHPGRR